LVQMFKPRRNEDYEENLKKIGSKTILRALRFFVVCTNLCCSDLAVN
jgi:hypothetical protein